MKVNFKSLAYVAILAFLISLAFFWINKNRKAIKKEEWKTSGTTCIPNKEDVRLSNSIARQKEFEVWLESLKEVAEKSDNQNAKIRYNAKMAYNFFTDTVNIKLALGKPNSNGFQFLESGTFNKFIVAVIVVLPEDSLVAKNEIYKGFFDGKNIAGILWDPESTYPVLILNSVFPIGPTSQGLALSHEYYHIIDNATVRKKLGKEFKKSDKFIALQEVEAIEIQIEILKALTGKSYITLVDDALEKIKDLPIEKDLYKKTLRVLYPFENKLSKFFNPLSEMERKNIVSLFCLDVIFRMCELRHQNKNKAMAAKMLAYQGYRKI